MNITYRGKVFEVRTEVELLALVRALALVEEAA